MSDLKAAYSGKRVLVTGDLGFVGGWLRRALHALGAEVSGFDIKRSPGEDIRLYHTIRGALRYAPPDFVFHLAAQAFVPRGYREPRYTFETNALGTINLLDALHAANRPCAVVIVTTDKVYGEGALPRDLGGPFTEASPLVARCPYSASKIAAENAVASYRDAYFAPDKNRIAVAAARAGNVIGGGDWGEGRLVPNAIRALREGKPVPVYNPDAVRPWQYVEDVVQGYLLLGAALWDEHGKGPSPFYSAFNFGPETHHTVQVVVEAVIRVWGIGRWQRTAHDLNEVRELRIDSVKARTLLGWRSKYDFPAMIRAAVEWYKVGRTLLTPNAPPGPPSP